MLPVAQVRTGIAGSFRIRVHPAQAAVGTDRIRVIVP